MGKKILTGLSLLIVLMLLAAVSCSFWNQPPTKPVPKGYYIEPIGMKGRLQTRTSVDEALFQKEGELNFQVEVTNTSSQTLEKAELIYSLYDENGIPVDKDRFLKENTIRYLRPGETVIINSQKGGLGLTEKISKYEFTFRYAEWYMDNNLYSTDNFSADPVTPAEVSIAYFCFTAKIDYENTKNLLSANVSGQLLEKDFWEKENAVPFSSGFRSVLIIREYIYNTYAKVELITYFGSEEEVLPVAKYLVPENGKWKIDKKRDWME